MTDNEHLRRDALHRRSRRLLGTGRILDGDEVGIISERIVALCNAQPRTPTRQQIADDIGRAVEQILATEMERNREHYEQQERRRLAAVIDRCTGKGGATRAALRARLGDHIYSSWFASMHFESFDDGVVRFSVPVKYMRNWIAAHYAELLLECCTAEFTGAVGVEMILR